MYTMTPHPATTLAASAALGVCSELAAAPIPVVPAQLASTSDVFVADDEVGAAAEYISYGVCSGSGSSACRPGENAVADSYAAGADSSPTERPNVDPLVKGLMSRIPGIPWLTCRRLRDTNDLTIARDIKRAYPHAGPRTKERIDSDLFYRIVRENTRAISGRYFGITRTCTGRHTSIISELEYVLPFLRKQFPDQKIVIRDEGVSTGLVTLPVYRDIAEKLDDFRYTATDLATQLLFLTDECGVIAVFSNAPKEAVHERPIQMKTGNTVVSNPDGELSERFARVFQGYRRTGTLPPGFSVETMSAFNPNIDSLEREEPRFQTGRHNLFVSLPPEEHAHLTILSNVLVPYHKFTGTGYYSREELKKGLRAVGNNLINGGIALVINDRSGYYTRHVFSLFQRMGNRFAAYDRSLHGFTDDRYDDIREVEL